MARIRTIKPEFWSSEKVVECSVSARLLFIGLWNFSDDGGRMEDKPRQIKMKIFPGDDFTADKIDEMLNELSVNKLIIRYEVEKSLFIQIKGWKHQKINRALPSKIPKVPAPAKADHGGISESHLPEGKGREGKGTGREEDKPLSSLRSDAPPSTENSDFPDSKKQDEKTAPPLLLEPEEKTKRKTQLAKDWKLPASCGEWAAGKAEEKSVTLDLDDEAEKFRNYHRAKGSKMADWRAAWRTWILNACKFAAERGGPGFDGPSPMSRADQAKYIEEKMAKAGLI